MTLGPVYPAEDLAHHGGLAAFFAFDLDQGASVSQGLDQPRP